MGHDLLATFSCDPLDSKMPDTAAANPAHLICIMDIVDDPETADALLAALTL